MTRPARLPLFGQVRLRRVRKERLIALWQSVVRKTGITIHNGVRVERIAQQPWGFEVTTSAGPALTRTVLLATGRRGVPRKLGVPGEHLSHVAYRVDDPARYRGQHVLIVGGGDSALEAALALARERVAAITVTYRGSVPARAKPAIRRRFEDVVAAGRITVIAGSHVGRIETGRAIVFVGQRAHAIRADSVIICAGGVLPMELLSDIGVRVETKYGTA
jgi:thioredoxin reductase